MKTIKFLQRVNVIFLALILFSACTSLFIEPENRSTISFSKEDPAVVSLESFMPYGTSPLVDLEFGTFRDSVALYIPADTSIWKIELWMDTSDEPIEVEHGDITLTLAPNYNSVYIYTYKGAFRTEYIKGAKFGYVMINDKIVATYDLATQEYAFGSGVVPEDMFVTDGWLSAKLP